MHNLQWHLYFTFLILFSSLQNQNKFTILPIIIFLENFFRNLAIKIRNASIMKGNEHVQPVILMLNITADTAPTKITVLICLNSCRIENTLDRKKNIFLLRTVLYMQQIWLKNTRAHRCKNALI